MDDEKREKGGKPRFQQQKKRRAARIKAIDPFAPGKKDRTDEEVEKTIRTGGSVRQNQIERGDKLSKSMYDFMSVSNDCSACTPNYFTTVVLLVVV